jgi:predicted nucleotidyltransferase
MATVIGGASEVRKDLLRFFHVRSGASGHVRAIARQIGRDPGAVSRELRRLEEQGLIVAETVGRSRVYRVAPNSRAAREMRVVIQRTLGVESSLRQALADLPGIDEAFIFGSYAAGSERAGSDIDLLVIGSPSSDELRRRIGAVGRELRRDVNLIELTAAELRKLRAKRDPFVRDVLSHPRVVVVPAKTKRG